MRKPTRVDEAIEISTLHFKDVLRLSNRECPIGSAERPLSDALHKFVTKFICPSLACNRKPLTSSEEYSLRVKQVQRKSKIDNSSFPDDQ